MAEPNPACNSSVSYVIGDTARDSLTSASCREGDGTYLDYHSFQTGGQADLKITLSSPSFPAVVQVLDQRGAIIVNSLVVNPADTATTVRVKLGDGTYLLVVHGATSGGRGPYRLVAAADTAPVAGCVPVWVVPGITTAQKLVSTDCTKGPGGTKYYYHAYYVVLLNTQTVNFTEHSTAFAPGMFLSATDGTTRSVLDSASTTAVLSFIAPRNGLWALWVGSNDSLQLGAYTLTIQ
jgi:hypothetical protein